jgi:hypothetical protein
MMNDLVQRGEELARQKQQERLEAVAQQLRAVFGAAAVQVDEAEVLVSGRGLVKRWLLDPSLRFLDGGLK